MPSATRMLKPLSALAFAMLLLGCEEPPSPPAASTASSAPPAAQTTTAPATASVKQPAKEKPSHPCPEGSEGEGTNASPCEAKGAMRVMEAKWTGKMDDEKGPAFQVINKTKLEIIYGRVTVYFYDKDGKQLEVPPPKGAGKEAKPTPHRQCGGRIFAGPMKADEKAVLWFSCAQKKHVPEGTDAVEAEIEMVGFTGKDGKVADTYWRNQDLIPQERPKGGVK